MKMGPNDFPNPEEGKRGWPWDVNKTVLAEAMPNGRSWPKISIVTPNYNYGQYLEETIRSVLLQNYPNLEYIIMDGASTDNSVEIIKKYEPWITYWESEKDRGQAHAINKGFARATGELLVWINSDDILLKDSLLHVAEACTASPRALILGDVLNFSDDEAQSTTVKQCAVSLQSFIGVHETGFSWNQPGTFVPTWCYQEVGRLDESLNFAFDWDWMCRILIQKPDIAYVGKSVAGFRLHDVSKTGAGWAKCLEETFEVVLRYKGWLCGVSLNNVKAYYYMRLASAYFAEHEYLNQYWDRRKGIISLFQAFLRNPALVGDEHFIRLLIRALLPRALYRTSPADF